MSDNSPRWPGADGSPGLDFSSPSAKKDEASKDEKSVDDAAKADDSRPAETADSAPASESTPARAEEATDTHVIPAVGGKDTGKSEAKEAASETAFTKRDSASLNAQSASSAPVVPAPAASDDKPARAKKEPKSSSSAVTPKVRRTRKARLRLARLDPWSVMKTTFLFAVAFGVMTVVIVSVLWTVLSGSGAIEALDGALATLFGDADNNTPFHLEDYLNTSRILGFTALIAAIDVVIITAVATLFAFLYNLSATILGGLEVTLAED